jgi:hypothetical protein
MLFGGGLYLPEMLGAFWTQTVFILWFRTTLVEGWCARRWNRCSGVTWFRALLTPWDPRLATFAEIWKNSFAV